MQTLADLDIRTIVLQHPDQDGKPYAKATTVFCAQHYGVAQAGEHARIVELRTLQWVRLFNFNTLDDAVPALLDLEALGPTPTTDNIAAGKYLMEIFSIFPKYDDTNCQKCLLHNLTILFAAIG